LDTNAFPLRTRALFKEIEVSSYNGYCTIELVSAWINESPLGSALAIKRVRELLE